MLQGRALADRNTKKKKERKRLPPKSFRALSIPPRSLPLDSSPRAALQSCRPRAIPVRNFPSAAKSRQVTALGAAWFWPQPSCDIYGSNRSAPDTCNESVSFPRQGGPAHDTFYPGTQVLLTSLTLHLKLITIKKKKKRIVGLPGNFHLLDFILKCSDRQEHYHKRQADGSAPLVT